MPTYLMVSTLTADAMQAIKSNPTGVLELNREIAKLGATVKAQWATLGRFDFVSVIDAPDEMTIARVSVELASRGAAHYETLTAIPVDELLCLL